MSEVLDINGEQFVPSKVAAKQVGYTGDYVARLAREEKISARKIGNIWYVSLDSLQQFTELTNAEKEERRAELREERKHELRNGQLHTSGDAPVINTHEPVETEHAALHGRAYALAQTMGILLLGTIVGTTGYVASTNHPASLSVLTEVSYYEQLAASVYDILTPDAAGRISYESTTASTQGEAADRNPSETSDEEDAGINAREQFANVVENTFSDKIDVEVSEENPNVAMVFPILEERRESPYEFVLLPISGSETVDADFYRSLMSQFATTTLDVADSQANPASNVASESGESNKNTE